MTKTVEMVITGAQVLNVYTREFEATSLWIDHGRIISNLRDEPYIAAQHVDATGQWFFIFGCSQYMSTAYLISSSLDFK